MSHIKWDVGDGRQEGRKEKGLALACSLGLNHLQACTPPASAPAPPHPVLEPPRLSPAYTRSQPPSAAPGLTVHWVSPQTQAAPSAPSAAPSPHPRRRSPPAPRSRASLLTPSRVRWRSLRAAR